MIKALKALGPSTPGQVYTWVRTNETVPASDLARSTADGKDTLFEKEIRWARKDLFDKGIVVSPTRGVWALS
ncbi:winged helix-turn-helix domain-containing protein [Chelatococcus reniformis]|uniref:winged helix-turn-helix domain-containing protein n=1 Tax=Chelatococcus reniformis TaxID=1494448 RepID=UPI003570E316